MTYDEIDDQAEQVVNDIFDAVPEYPCYRARKVGGTHHAYAKLGDCLFRGDGPTPRDALADLDSQVIRHRQATEDDE